MQHLQPSTPPQVIRLAIAKFSHTTTAIDHVGPLTWNHVPGKVDLVCIFEKFLNLESVPSKMIQKVVRGDSILIRRFQIKFTTEREYFAALTLLGEINCPLTEGKIPVPALQRFPSASSWTSGQPSSVATRAINTAATPFGNNGVHFYPAGALGSGRTRISHFYFCSTN
ncbi:hypothetical protein PDIG_08700 [Penicillium digitatum PHI26]|uniref:Uncharacterized protein n=2 Tax=Penicillium digitatum TaxID=36651 RepID=K9H035_PEND2|nr:hypothetical protein PDIP_36730 [Penicillium digitatum Pd1]EKV16340.1 hypothetical protein PDIP_36730 [Penicillium digitatum Pd1]EKV18556.1 hypothetical protein PDIG_08700 [Penicillium digitatum PHI26]